MMQTHISTLDILPQDNLLLSAAIRSGDWFQTHACGQRHNRKNLLQTQIAEQVMAAAISRFIFSR
jgi:hypothetical protein